MNRAAHWDQLHESPRFRPTYPNDHVVRFLMANRRLADSGPAERFLDIGTGAGRHLKLAADLGFAAYGIDNSLLGVQHAHERLQDARRPHLLAQATMLQLPFRESSFKIVLSFGVMYYATAAEMKLALREAHRVLLPGGKAFTVLRTTHDYRFGRGEEVERHTFRLDITDTNEFATVQHFLSEEDVPSYFADFSSVSFEKSETTTMVRTRVDSDWLITAEK